MPLNPSQQQTLERWIHSKAVVQCPACGDSKWRFAEASYVRALLEPGEVDLTEAGGVVKLPCDSSRAVTAGTWRSSTPRRWEFGDCGTKGGTYNVSGDGPSGEGTIPYRLFLGAGDDFSPPCLPSQRA